ncbi:MAG: LD-carboxypeptidase [Pseudarcicella sp.]|jgi:muramoyltetrapeptide carboxypeptidase|nr:LD-carboxypeptidase [Pseudarcicella sp.]MBP6411244.1 LD-carboxypeptidase [Pseudarcicella sp.]
MIKPEYLKKGDTIGIVAMAGKVKIEELNASIKLFENWGLNVVWGENTFEKNYRFAGTDDQRKQDFQKMLNEPSIKAIFSARGGYGSHRFIDDIDFEIFKQKPKWIIGYSDITTVLCTINRLNIECIHGLMPKNFAQTGTEKALESLHKILFGKKISYTVKSSKYDKIGEAKAEIVGGNLCTFVHLLGTESFPDCSNKILLIEDINEQLHNIDRMMYQLKRAGVLKNLVGIIVGQFTESIDDKKNPFGKNANEIIQAATLEYQYPIVHNFPVGHEADNFAIPIGRIASLSVKEKNTTLNFD